MKSLLKLLLLWPLYSAAALHALSDADLLEVSGQAGLGIILDEVAVITDPDTRLNINFDTNLNDDALFLDHFYLYASDSSANCKNNPSTNTCNGISIGTLNDPLKLNLATENGTSFIDIKFPANDISSEKFDLGARIAFDFYQNHQIIDTSWLSLDGVRLTGTQVRLWAIPGQGLASAATINVSIDSLTLDLSTNTTFDISQEYKELPPYSSSYKAGGITGSIVSFSDINVYLPLGVFEYQPLTIQSLPGGHLDITLQPITSSTASAFYSNSSLLGDITIGSPCGYACGSGLTLGASNIGYNEIKGIQIQYLRVRTRDL